MQASEQQDASSVHVRIYAYHWQSVLFRNSMIGENLSVYKGFLLTMMLLLIECESEADIDPLYVRTCHGD